MRMSDIITQTILKMLNESGEDTAEIQRNELASMIGCVPSQINYVLDKRFTPEHGYIIESRRGGGGYIKITRVHLDKSSAVMHIVNSIGSGLDGLAARVLIENCLAMDLIDKKTAALMSAAVSNAVLREVPSEYHNAFRAAVLKQMLMTQV
jgi:transcriptional repressor, ctsR